MKKNRLSMLIRILIFAGIAAAIIGICAATGWVKFDEIAPVSFNWTTLVKFIVMVLCVLAAETLVSLVLSLFNPKRHRARSMISIFDSLLKYVAGLVILCWGLSIFGVNVSTIVASVGILALIVGFSAESLIADVVTGAFMIFENQYNVGDIVEVDNFRGTVTKIGIRTTCITDPGDNVKIVNNSAMKNILNRSDKLSRSISDIAIPYGTDLEKLESQIPALMDEIFSAHPDMMKAPPVYLGVQALADSAVVLRFLVNVDERDIYSGARVLNHDLLLGFRRLGVECPFPQVDVHNKD